MARIIIPIIAVFTLGCGGSSSTVQSQVQTFGRQAWLIAPAEGEVRTHCVSLGSGGEGALETLRATAEPLTLLEDPVLGAAVCKIDEVGWPVTACFGSSADDPSWLFFIWNKESAKWEVPWDAVSDVTVKDGDLLAFVFTRYDAEFNPVRTPPDATFDEICP